MYTALLFGNRSQQGMRQSFNCLRGAGYIALQHKCRQEMGMSSSSSSLSSSSPLEAPLIDCTSLDVNQIGFRAAADDDASDVGADDFEACHAAAADVEGDDDDDDDVEDE